MLPPEKEETLWDKVKTVLAWAIVVLIGLNGLIGGG